MRARSSWCRGSLVVALLATAASACATNTSTQPQVSSSRLGHSQPLPATGEASQAPPDDRGPAPPRDGAPEASDAPGAPAASGAPDTPGQEPESSVPVVVPEDEALCRHITSVVMAESEQSTPPTREQLDELIASCALALAYDRRNLDAAEFRRRAACVRATNSVAQFAACRAPGP